MRHDLFLKFIFFILRAGGRGRRMRSTLALLLRNDSFLVPIFSFIESSWPSGEWSSVKESSLSRPWVRSPSV